MSAGRSACQVFTGDRTSWVQAETQGEERGGALISDRSSNGSAAKGIEAKGDTGLIGDRDSVVRFQPLNEMSRRGPDSDSMASVRAAADHTTFSRLCWNARSTDAGEQSADGIDSNAQPPALQCRGFGRSTCRGAVVRWCGGAVVRWLFTAFAFTPLIESPCTGVQGASASVHRSDQRERPPASCAAALIPHGGVAVSPRRGEGRLRRPAPAE